MSDPSWLPTWPAGNPDYEGHYKTVLPNQWPQNLYAEDSEVRKDQQAFAVVMSWIRKASWWIGNNIYPWLDAAMADAATITEPLFLDRWEEVFALFPKGTTYTERANRVLASMRNRGTLTLERVKAIFGPIFATSDPAKISTAGPTPEMVWTRSFGWRRRAWGLDPTLDIWGITGPTSGYNFACGDTGAIWLYTGGTWNIQTSGTAENLYGIWCGNGDYTFAVAVGNNSAIREWDGGNWAAGPVGAPAGSYRRISCTPELRYDSTRTKFIPEQIWICGLTGVIGLWDASGWTDHTTGANHWLDIHAYAKDDVWVCSAAGTYGHWDGSSWTTGNIDGVTSFGGIRKCSNGWVYAVGAGGVIYRRSPTTGTWAVMTSGTTEDLTSLDGVEADKLVAVGTSGVTLIYDGFDWRTIYTGLSTDLRSVWRDRKSVWTVAAGDNGRSMVSPTCDEGFAANQGCQHVYSTSGDLDPDLDTGRDKCTLCHAVNQRWSLGRYKTLEVEDTEGTGANNACPG